jgi:hypothetical protein
VPDDDRQRTPIDLALDLFVYAPLGFVAEAPSLLPLFARRGREQAALAHGLATYALHRDPEQLDDLLDEHPDLRSRLAALGLVERADPKDGSMPAPTPLRPRREPPAGDRDTHRDGDRDGEHGHERVTDRPMGRANSTDIDPSSLAILDYESLSASQVVPRLESLTADELEAVRTYENGNRARRTILNKIAQLQAS